eukprot:5870842-Lingulodinium_polyedra.AAC.1
MTAAAVPDLLATVLTTSATAGAPAGIAEATGIVATGAAARTLGDSAMLHMYREAVKNWKIPGAPHGKM